MEPGTKYDVGKPQWNLLPWNAVKEVVEVLTMGATKYAPNNWQQVRPVERYKDAAFRHLTTYCMGEKIDSETGKSHLSHAIASLLFLLWFELEGIND